MLLINRKQSDPFFNIAAEEYFLKNFDDEFVMIWQNNPSVVIGKHQNTFAEINTSYLDEKNIPVIRRISGGGTVFHDDGNLNYSVITKSGSQYRILGLPKGALIQQNEQLYGQPRLVWIAAYDRSSI